jgi:hypothetical protein
VPDPAAVASLLAPSAAVVLAVIGACSGWTRCSPRVASHT